MAPFSRRIFGPAAPRGAAALALASAMTIAVVTAMAIAAPSSGRAAPAAGQPGDAAPGGPKPGTGLSATPPTIVAQKQQSPARPDAGTRDLAARKAGAFRLSSADGARTCALTLEPDPAPAGFRLQLDRAACEATIAFLSQVAAWMPDPSGALRLVGAQGRTVAEFTEATGGSYEALREGDGVYFLLDLRAAEAPPPAAAPVGGDWDLSSGSGQVLCRWSLTDAPGPKGGQAVQVAPGCAPAVARLAPVSWRLEQGNILISTADRTTIRFAPQEDGGWARVPERGRPLLMSRP